MSYHYTDCGLDNVYLENGYHFHETPYGEGVSIENTEGLHQAIGEWIVETPKPMNGAELRFLRVEMDLTQRDLASLIGGTEQTLRLWEKKRDKGIPGPADRLVRLLYSEHIGGEGPIHEMVKRLAELDQIENASACLTETEQGWKLAA